MAWNEQLAKVAHISYGEQEPTGKQKATADASNEFIFAVVGHVGSGTSVIARQLESALENTDFGGESVDVEVISARPFLEDWATDKTKPKPDVIGTQLVKWYQDIGDDMRRENGDFSVVARNFALEIRQLRAIKTGQKATGNNAILPDGKPRAYILDSIRHPEEVRLLRHIYQDAFVLIGVVCAESVRIERLMQKYSQDGLASCKELMSRDAESGANFGQRTRDAFHMADFFLDNTINRMTNVGGQDAGNPNWNIPQKLDRLIKILSNREIVRPTIDETAMHHAYSAQLRSACLSRQVGAALIDKSGSLLASGTNEVPRAGGGVYGELPERSLTTHFGDHRCAFRSDKFCSNTREQNEIISETLEQIESVLALGEKRQHVERALREGRIGMLLEFSRAVHAEMDALLSAARSEQPIEGARLFVTTYPCHYCARHIVTAGIDEVQYIEPFPKSAALKLHNDAICIDWLEWEPPSLGGSKVLFRPFTGVAPRMYRRAFQKTSDLKDKLSGDLNIHSPQWPSAWHLGKSSYVTLEASLLYNP